MLIFKPEAALALIVFILIMIMGLFMGASELPIIGGLVYVIPFIFANEVYKIMSNIIFFIPKTIIIVLLPYVSKLKSRSAIYKVNYYFDYFKEFSFWFISIILFIFNMKSNASVKEIINFIIAISICIATSVYQIKNKKQA